MWNTGLKSKPGILLYTPGEPAGIGPDLILLLAQEELAAPIIVLGNKACLEERAKQLGLAITLHDWQPDTEPEHLPTGQLWVRNIDLPVTCEAGRLERQNSPYVLECLSLAVELCLTHDNMALVTGPVHKGIINDAGIAFSGHTEFLAEKSNTDQTVMMLTTTGLRVALATTHLPLTNVPAAITVPGLTQTIEILQHDLVNRFGIKTPRICVCGLNPHAGESGHLGREEIDTIIPVIDALTKKGYQLTGPIPADTAFTPRYMQETDAFLCMYHDQGLPVLKHIGFGNAINITLGLPFVRTSVDHGTALELAGTGEIDTGSLRAAIQTALSLLAQHAE